MTGLRKYKTWLNNHIESNGTYPLIAEMIAKIDEFMDDDSKCYTEKDMDKAYDKGFDDCDATEADIY